MTKTPNENSLENRVERLQHEIQTVLDAAIDTIVIIDWRGCIESVNRAGERLFGYREADLIGKNVNVLMPNPYRAEHDGYLERYLATGKASIIGIGREVKAQRRDGSIIDVELAVGRIEGGELPRFVGFIRDISKRKDAEEALRQMQSRQAHFGRISTMGEMAAGIAHEINQPLAAIATYAQGCLRFLNDPQHLNQDDLLEGLKQIESQALRAGEVIRRLRSFVKNREVRREQVDANQILEDLLALAKTDTQHHGVRTVRECAANLPAVNADPVQIQQVILNLLRNSIDAMSDLPHEQREVVLTTRLDEQGDVEFSVSDRGPGLSEQAQAELFNQFFTTKPGGTGLGLAISQSIVRAHGGKVWYRPRSGGGASFFFTLPAAQPMNAIETNAIE